MRDEEELLKSLERNLQRGPVGAAELRGALGISQPAFSRLVRRANERLLVAGRARATRYALRRSIEGVGQSVPIYLVGERGASKKVATLHAIAQAGFYVEGHDPDFESQFHGDLPYFLNDMRPSGFLGRLIPAQHPELEHPADIRLWSAEHCLRYLTRYGWNLSGNLIVGDPAFARYLSSLRAPAIPIPEALRAKRYPELAADTLKASEPGSSAAGEQPKFLATLGPDRTDVLVKFSPAVVDKTTERWADLLYAEHWALQTLCEHGIDAARSRVVSAGERVFLETVRFDRLAEGGRRGLLSLLALDAEFVGHLRSWGESARRLAERGHIDRGAEREVRRQELFSQLISNTDRHAGNLSFFTHGTRVLGVAPAYDVSPTHYAPRQGHVEAQPLEPPVPAATDGPLWRPVYDAARDFWSRLAADERISRSFRRVAPMQDRMLRAWQRMAEQLPMP